MDDIYFSDKKKKHSESEYSSAKKSISDKFTDEDFYEDIDKDIKNHKAICGFFVFKKIIFIVQCCYTHFIRGVYGRYNSKSKL